MNDQQTSQIWGAISSELQSCIKWNLQRHSDESYRPQCEKCGRFLGWAPPLKDNNDPPLYQKIVIRHLDRWHQEELALAIMGG